jgi:hypothetical protein
MRARPKRRVRCGSGCNQECESIHAAVNSLEPVENLIRGIRAGSHWPRIPQRSGAATKVTNCNPLRCLECGSLLPPLLGRKCSIALKAQASLRTPKKRRKECCHENTSLQRSEYEFHEKFRKCTSPRAGSFLRAMPNWLGRRTVSFVRRRCG